MSDYVPLPRGTSLNNGTYTLSRLLAVGGMGAVYKGYRGGTQGFYLPVAVKELLPSLSDKKPLVDLFFSEARLHANLNHSNIVRVVDLFYDNARYYIVLEWVDGLDLRGVIKALVHKTIFMPINISVFIFSELLQALDYAHTIFIYEKNIKGIIHRDLSPSNILISRSGEVKLTDFGISQAGTRLEGFKKVPGKKGYMPPEHQTGEIGEARSDIYSLMVCFYEVLALVNPLAVKSRMGYIPSMKKFRPDIPPLLEEIIFWGLETYIEDRPTARDLIYYLQNLATQEGLQVSSLVLADFLANELTPDTKPDDN
ncbi:serine/threonine protein kinase [Myxococcota bacterium]|nr:serine/threonine protein kinase [Myxococcota bacterium]MBU1381501.1 serine/threonine protein kinase [Myxococcota bacterium]MBU1497508.1 serine/threonine protein kinase [Myxococcota bacterium]